MSSTENGIIFGNLVYDLSNQTAQDKNCVILSDIHIGMYLCVCVCVFLSNFLHVCIVCVCVSSVCILRVLNAHMHV